MIGVIADYQEENIDILLPEDNMPTSLASHLDDLCVFFEHAEQSISCGVFLLYQKGGCKHHPVGDL